MGLLCGEQYIAVSSDGELCYHPDANGNVRCYRVHTGCEIDGGLHGGHFDHVTCIVLHPHLSDTYTGGKDFQILAWEHSATSGLDGNTFNPLDDEYEQDSWSD